MQRSSNSMKRDDEEEESSLLENTNDPTCNECGTSYRKPLLATNTSNGSEQQYYACPRCLTKVSDVKAAEKEESHKVLPAKDFKKVEPEPENDVKCQHFLGYLKKRAKDAPIPDECLTCASMVECLYK